MKQGAGRTDCETQQEGKQGMAKDDGRHTALGLLSQARDIER